MTLAFRDILKVSAPVVLWSFLSSLFAADQPARPQTPLPHEPAASAESNPSKVGAITQAAVRAGVLSCAGRVEQVASFLTLNSRNGAVLFVPPSQPDQRLFSTSIEIENKDAPLAYASATFAPGMANGCGTVYDSVVYWNVSCDEISTRNFAGAKRVGVLSRGIGILDAGLGSRIFLMPAGAGCVSIKKEVVQ
jgi:hypothetical protein